MPDAKLDDYLKKLEQIDLNKNGKPDKEEFVGYFKRIWNWIKTNKKQIMIYIIIFVLGGIGASVYFNKDIKSKATQTFNQSVEKVKEVVVYKPKEGVFAIDLGSMEVGKRIETISSKSGKDIFGVWYKLETPEADSLNSTYLTIYENVDNLKYNKKEFDKYVEMESKKAADLSKGK